MGKLIYSMNVSLDGFIETPDHSLEWADVDEEVHSWFNEQTRDLGRVDLRPADVRGDDRAIGRRVASDPNATPAIREYATISGETCRRSCSRGRSSSVGFGCRLVKGDIGDELAKLRQRSRRRAST